MKPKLSFCIPTYNFGNFIGETLESIISQATDEIEIVIVDGASTDNTKEVILAYQEQFPRIRYFLRDKNIGVDMDIDKAVELAQGEYCWLMSSDDKLSPRAVRRMINEIKYGLDIYLCNRIECDFSMAPVKNRLWLSHRIGDRVFDLTDRNNLISYFNRARSIGALFSYCSSIVFSKRGWDKVVCNDKFSNSGYAHVYKLFSFVNNNCSLKYIRDPLVMCRGNNDSFLVQGAVKRFLLDIDGYELLADSLFPEDANVKRAFLRVIRREILLPYLIKIRSLIDEIELWREIEKKLSYYGYSPITLFIARNVGSLKSLVSILYHIKQRVKNRNIFK